MNKVAKFDMSMDQSQSKAIKLFEFPINEGRARFITHLFSHLRSLVAATVVPILSDTVFSGQPLLSGQLSKSIDYCNFDLYFKQ